MKRIEGQAAICDESGTVILHQHDDEGRWRDLLTDRYDNPCHWCAIGVPSVTHIYRYVIDEDGVDQQVLIGARAADVQPATEKVGA